MKYINGLEMKNALINAHANLTNERNTIDALNVFPVPDGDTGTNMLLTFTSGIDAIRKIEENHLGRLMQAFSKGLLMGARGNSGVILSQIFRGMAIVLAEEMEADVCMLSESLISARNVAYKAVMSPVEGTILTVISDIAKCCNNCREIDVLQFSKQVLESGEVSLENTPNLLPVLKEAGVVDSGGYGLLVIFKGIDKFLNGEILAFEEETEVLDTLNIQNTTEEFGYCTEFIIELDEEKVEENHFTEDRLKQQLIKIGDSLVVVHDDDIVKVHVHTLIPGEALNIGQKYGEFLKLKIENMTVQHSEVADSQPRRKYAIVCVSPGEGISKMFKELGATHIIDGGQTMNPSTNDFSKIIENANAENVILIPNNSNIIMAASQAKNLMDSNEVHVEVIPTKSVSQCQVALTFFNEDASISENLEEMVDAYSDLKYGEVTYAVRDTVMNDVEVKKGQYIAIFDKKIITSVKDRSQALMSLLEAMTDDDNDIISIITGNDVDDSDELEEMILSTYEDYEVEIYEGKQNIYSYFVSVE